MRFKNFLTENAQYENFKDKIIEDFPEEETAASIFADYLGESGDQTSEKALRTLYSKASDKEKITAFDDLSAKFYKNYRQDSNCRIIGIDAGGNINVILSDTNVMKKMTNLSVDKLQGLKLENLSLLFGVPIVNSGYVICRYYTRNPDAELGQFFWVDYFRSAVVPDCVKENLFSGILLYRSGLYRTLKDIYQIDN